MKRSKKKIHFLEFSINSFSLTKIFLWLIFFRFRPRLLLEKLRNKRLMFVGDSLNRNQWESMICLLQSGVPFSWKKYKKIGRLSVFMIQVFMIFLIVRFIFKYLLFLKFDIFKMIFCFWSLIFLKWISFKNSFSIFMR